jgi:seryl-tRNA synthetase
MLDWKWVQKNLLRLQEALSAKQQNLPFPLERIFELDEEYLQIQREIQELQTQRNQGNRVVAQQKAKGEKISEKTLEELKDFAQSLHEKEKKRNKLEEELREKQLWLPNLPALDVPQGGESQNHILRTVGEKPHFPFTPKPHWELAESFLENERASSFSGSGFALLTGKGAALERALIQWMLSIHTEKHHYKEIAVPHLVLRPTVFLSGQLPKLETEMYQTQDGLFLIPTAEVPLVALYQGEILESEQLPLRLTAVSSCFRREAGSSGRDTRGLLRVHEFKKVELVQLVTPEQADSALEELLGHSERILQELQIPYRVVLLASGELSFASAKTYDIEVWAGGVGRWLEVSSCSSCSDFQARRANIRYKKKGGRARFVHTLNGSGVALPRLLIALLENNQERDGRIALPEVLRPWMRDALFL